jgi:predicted 2-oxoglutarate/Fe(II)-dependent dioxygenase YbiX
MGHGEEKEGERGEWAMGRKKDGPSWATGKKKKRKGERRGGLIFFQILFKQLFKPLFKSNLLHLFHNPFHKFF